MFHQIFCFHICNINNEYSLFKKKKSNHFPLQDIQMTGADIML
jgi:hypothetical protein